jgi:hypothetical protein
MVSNLSIGLDIWFGSIWGVHFNAPRQKCTPLIKSSSPNPKALEIFDRLGTGEKGTIDENHSGSTKYDRLFARHSSAARGLGNNPT